MPGRSRDSTRTDSGSRTSCSIHPGESLEDPVSGMTMHGTPRGLPYSAQASARPSSSRMPANGREVAGATSGASSAGSSAGESGTMPASDIQLSETSPNAAEVSV